MICSGFGAGDTTVTASLRDLARDSDLFILQNMGPIADFEALSYESQFLLNVSTHNAPRSPASSMPLLGTSPVASSWHIASKLRTDLGHGDTFAVGVQTSHITPLETGPLLAELRPRLAVIHHLTVWAPELYDVRVLVDFQPGPWPRRLAVTHHLTVCSCLEGRMLQPEP